MGLRHRDALADRPTLNDLLSRGKEAEWDTSPNKPGPHR